MCHGFGGKAIRDVEMLRSLSTARHTWMGRDQRLPLAAAIVHGANHEPERGILMGKSSDLKSS